MPTDATADADRMSKNLYSAFAAADKDDNVWVRTSKAMIGKLARPLLLRMGLTEDRTDPVQLLDNAAGAGVVAQELHALLQRSTLESGLILAGDSSAAMVNVIRKRTETEGWVNVQSRVLDAQVRKSAGTIRNVHWLMLSKRTRNCLKTLLVTPQSA